MYCIRKKAPFLTTFSAYFRKAGHVCVLNKKRAYFKKFRSIRGLSPSKKHLNLKFVECENIPKNPKGALCAGSTHNKCLK